MENTAKMEYKDSERRSIELIVPKDVTKIKLEFDTANAQNSFEATGSREVCGFHL